MRCFGITGINRRCLREGNPLFCPEHAPQPWIALVSTALGFSLSVASSLLATHLWVASSETELKPSDFDIEVVLSRYGVQKPYQFDPTESLNIPVRIGSVLIDSTLAFEPRGAHRYEGGRNPWQTWYYPSKRLNVTLQENTTMESLVGKTISADIPLRAIRPRSRNKLRIWIKGREITLTPSENGNIKYALTNQDLGIDG